ncbi:MAG: RDD family protein [Ilumatobacter sp.]
MTNTGGTPAGWYHAPGDPEGTQRYWDGAQWIGDPQAVPQQAAPAAPQQPQQPQQPSDATVAYTPPVDPNAGQPPQYGAPPQAAPPNYGQQPPAGGQAPQYGAAPGGQPPQYGSPPPGAGAPPGYVAYGQPGSVGAAGNLAEGWQRLVGRFIDGIIVGIAAFIIGFIVAIALDNVIGGIFSGLIGVAIGVGYELLLTSKMGATLGKQIFNMRIVNEHDGSKVDDQVMLRRMLPVIVIGVIGSIPILGLIAIPLNLVFVILSLVWIFTDDKRRSVYDKAGKTIVIVEP